MPQTGTIKIDECPRCEGEVSRVWTGTIWQPAGEPHDCIVYLRRLIRSLETRLSVIADDDLYDL